MAVTGSSKDGGDSNRTAEVLAELRHELRRLADRLQMIEARLGFHPQEVTAEPPAREAMAMRAEAQLREETRRNGPRPSRDAIERHGNDVRRGPADRDLPPSEKLPGFQFTGRNAQGYPQYRHARTQLILVLLPGGEFDMGEPEGGYGKSFGSSADEHPVHRVRLSPFLIAKYTVTRSDWYRITGDPLPEPLIEGEHPMWRSWDDWQEFCREVGLRFPTEAQWEYACRAGTGQGAFSFGTGSPGHRMIYLENYPGRGSRREDYEGPRPETAPVGSCPANPFGLHEMHGNIQEWCEDIYDRSFYRKAKAKGPDPVATSGSKSRVLRGGSCESESWECRSAARSKSLPSGPRSRLGGLRPAFGPLSAK